MYADILHTLAEVAATLAGFIGVVFVLGRRSQRDLDASERSALFHLLYTSVGVLFLAVLQLIILAGTAGALVTWQVANGVSGAYHLAGVLRATLELRRGQHGLIPVLGHPLKIGSYMIVATQFILMFGIKPSFAPPVFLFGLAWLLLVSVSCFVSLLISPGRAK